MTAAEIQGFPYPQSTIRSMSTAWLRMWTRGIASDYAMKLVMRIDNGSLT
jgi:hypothetical protein